MTFAGGRGDGHALDVPVATLAGLSVAFVVFVAPADLLGELVGATGLPSLLAAAEPPLGFKARVALGVGAAGALFAATLLLLRWLGRLGSGDTLELDERAEAPRLRRRDFHPDASPRPPLLATAELGEPGLQPEFVPAPGSGPEPEPEPERQPEPEPEPDLVRRAWLTQEPEREPEPGPDAESDLLRRAWLPPEPASPPASPQPPSAPAFAASPAESPPAPPAVAEPPPSFGTSIPELIDRLERGLARRGPGTPAADAPPGPAAPPGEAGDERLQSAIESLQRLAARQS